MALEALVTDPRILADGWVLAEGVLDFAPLLAHLADHPEPGAGADLFHGTLIAGLAHWAEQAAHQSQCRTIVLGGGCFFNKVLVTGLVTALDQRGLTALTAINVSPGDPGLSLGQAWIAARTEI